MTASPNIFTYATSELSQDAFLAYLIEWANPELKGPMHRIGQLFVDKLLAVTHKAGQDLKLENLARVTVTCQKSSIDVLVNLHFKTDEHITLVIEDKIHAADYNNLEDYLERCGNIEECSRGDVRGIFLKTGEQFSYTKADNAEYGTFLRVHFVELFREADELSLQPRDTIFQQWRGQFEQRQLRLEGWKNRSVTDWGDNQFIGFSQHLTEVWIDEAGDPVVKEWRWVNPPSRGGFYGLWTQMISLVQDGSTVVYVQIQRRELIIRTMIDSNEGSLQSDHRNKLYLSLKRDGVLRQLNMTKPARFGQGRTMEICRAEFDESWTHQKLHERTKQAYTVLLAWASSRQPLS